MQDIDRLLRENTGRILMTANPYEKGRLDETSIVPT